MAIFLFFKTRIQDKPVSWRNSYGFAAESVMELAPGTRVTLHANILIVVYHSHVNILQPPLCEHPCY